MIRLLSLPSCPIAETGTIIKRTLCLRWFDSQAQALTGRGGAVHVRRKKIRHQTDTRAPRAVFTAHSTFSSSSSPHPPLVMRRLTLHASALNDEEYDLYTQCLADIALPEEDIHHATTRDDAYYEQMNIGIREARAWLRGRYSDVPAATLDAVCIHIIISMYFTSYCFVDSTLLFTQLEPGRFAHWRSILCCP